MKILTPTVSSDEDIGPNSETEGELTTEDVEIEGVVMGVATGVRSDDSDKGGVVVAVTSGVNRIDDSVSADVTTMVVMAGVLNITVVMGGKKPSDGLSVSSKRGMEVLGAIVAEEKVGVAIGEGVVIKEGVAIGEDMSTEEGMLTGGSVVTGEGVALGENDTGGEKEGVTS